MVVVVDDDWIGRCNSPIRNWLTPVMGTGAGVGAGTGNDGGSVFWGQPAGARVCIVKSRSRRALNIADWCRRVTAVANADINILVVVVVTHFCAFNVARSFYGVPARV